MKPHATLFAKFLIPHFAYVAMLFSLAIPGATFCQTPPTTTPAVVWPLDSIDKRLPNAGFMDALSAVEEKYISEIREIVSHSENKSVYFERISKAIENEDWYFSFQFVESLAVLLLSEQGYGYLVPHLSISYGINPYDARRPNYIGNFPVAFAIHKSATSTQKLALFTSLLQSKYFKKCLFQNENLSRFQIATTTLFSEIGEKSLKKASRRYRSPCQREFLQLLLDRAKD